MQQQIENSLNQLDNLNNNEINHNDLNNEEEGENIESQNLNMNKNMFLNKQDFDFVSPNTE